VNQLNQYNKIRVPKEWMATQGEGVTIGICDTSVDTSHEIIKNNILHVKRFIGEDTIATAHGTHVTGIITQLAPKCKLVIAIITNDRNGVFNTLEKGLEWIKQYNVDILNLSLSYTKQNKGIERQIQDILKNTTVIAPAITGQYPSSIPGVVSVGSFSLDYKADVYAPHTIRSSVPGGEYAEMSGCSMSCAYYAGVHACELAHKKRANTRDALGGGLHQSASSERLYNTCFI
jgi:subtilisin family serine protease